MGLESPTLPAGLPPGLAAEADVLARAAGENFPVAMRLLPSRHREHLTAIYGFARFVDDIGDELPGGPPARLAALDGVEAELGRMAEGLSEHPIFARLERTVRACGLDRRHLLALVEANRLDQRVSRYDTYDELLGYCRLSADPVGRLVLGVFGCGGAERERLSDLVCSGLQIVEHLQDVAEDAAAGRVYLPAEDLRRFGVEASFSPGVPLDPAARRLVAFESSRARAMLAEGSRLVSLVGGAARLAIAGFAGGGIAQLAAIERAGFDVTSRPVKASDAAVAAAALRLLAGARGRRR